MGEVDHHERQQQQPQGAAAVAGGEVAPDVRLPDRSAARVPAARRGLGVLGAPEDGGGVVAGDPYGARVAEHPLRRGAADPVHQQFQIGLRRRGPVGASTGRVHGPTGPGHDLTGPLHVRTAPVHALTGPVHGLTWPVNVHTGPAPALTWPSRVLRRAEPGAAGPVDPRTARPERSSYGPAERSSYGPAGRSSYGSAERSCARSTVLALPRDALTSVSCAVQDLRSGARVHLSSRNLPEPRSCRTVRQVVAATGADPSKDGTPAHCRTDGISWSEPVRRACRTVGGERTGAYA